MSIRLAHTWSSDVAMPWSVPYSAPLLARGWEITHICPDGPHVQGVCSSTGVRWLPLSLERRIAPWTDARGALELWRYFRAQRFDIVHTHNIKVGHISRVVAAAAQVPIIVHTHHGVAFSLDTPAAKRRLHALLERIASLPVDCALVQTNEDARTLIATGVIAPERIVLVGNGIDVSRFDPASVSDEMRTATRAAIGVAPEDVLFLTAGRLVREKGIVELLEAARRVRAVDPRVRLAIAGEVDREKADAVTDSLLDEARAAGVRILGRREDMPALYAAADVVVLASWREGLNRVLMEGAIMNKPLLVADARGSREIVVDGVNGLVVPLRDADALARAIQALASDAPLRMRLGRGHDGARDRFDVRTVAAKVIRVYEALLGGKRHGGRTDSTSRARMPDTRPRMNAPTPEGNEQRVFAPRRAGPNEATPV